MDLIKEDSIGYGLRFDRLYDCEFRKSIRQIDLCFTATKHMRSLAVEAGAAPTRTIVLHNSFSPLRADEAPEIKRPTGAAKLLLSVGHLIERKGFDRGVRALSLLPLDFHYVVVGDGPEHKSLLELAVHHNVADRVHFVGTVPPSEVASWMREADCYWFLSRAEAFGNVVVEAYAAGARIVATSLGVAPELANGDSAFILLEQPDDPKELADATTNVLTTKSGAGRAAVLRRFSPEERSRDLKRFYRNVKI